jgi:hypothetical protein
MLMRFLQTLVDVGAENNTTIVFPIPIDLFEPMLQNRASRNGQPDSGDDAETPSDRMATAR